MRNEFILKSGEIKFTAKSTVVRIQINHDFFSRLFYPKGFNLLKSKPFDFCGILSKS